MDRRDQGTFRLAALLRHDLGVAHRDEAREAEALQPRLQFLFTAVERPQGVPRGGGLLPFLLREGQGVCLFWGSVGHGGDGLFSVCRRARGPDFRGGPSSPRRPLP